MKNCKNCGKEFEPLRPKALFCSNKCRTYYHRKGKPAYVPQVNKTPPAQFIPPKTAMTEEEVKECMRELLKRKQPSYLSKAAWEKLKADEVKRLDQLLLSF